MAGRPTAAPEGIDFDPDRLEPAIQSLDFGDAGLRGAQAPGEPLRLIDGLGELGQPAGALGRTGTVHWSIHSNSSRSDGFYAEPPQASQAMRRYFADAGKPVVV